MQCSHSSIKFLPTADVDFKHRASLYLKAEGLSLSIINIFKAFHWLTMSYSVVLLLQVASCCFVLPSWLQSHLSDDYNVDSLSTWLCLHHFNSKNSLNCLWKFTLHGLHLICKTCDNLHVHIRGCTSKSVQNINNVHMTMTGIVWTSPWHLLKTVLSGF